MSTITLGGYDLGEIKANSHSITTPLISLNSAGKAVASTVSGQSSGPVRLINIRSERSNGATTNATVIGNIKALTAANQSYAGPYSLVITDASGNVPAETVSVVINNFTWEEGPATNEVTLNLTLTESASWV